MIMDKNVILAKKYGRAIYDIAAETQSLESIGNDLKLIADTLKENAELSNLLTHPILAKNIKKNTIESLFTGKVSTMVLNFCYVVIDKEHMNLFGDMVEIYNNLACHGLGMEEAIVTTAVPLTDEQAEMIKEKLGAQLGCKIILKQKVDAALIGVFTIQVGDRLIDGSVVRQLNALKAMMIQ